MTDRRRRSQGLSELCVLTWLCIGFWLVILSAIAYVMYHTAYAAMEPTIRAVTQVADRVER